MKKIKVKLKKGLGKHLRLTDPGFSFTIDSGDAIDVDETVYARIRKYVDRVVDKPKPIKIKSEKKSVTDIKKE
jgi:hypothetical protein